tara:strand:+ start:197 stop:787 length:591 start_codon:yes stop_codon:yes gene_type:complete
MVGWVYLIRNKDLYKIGITRNLKQRIKQLNPDGVLATRQTNNFISLEKALHKRYKDVRIPQTEYFRLTKSQLNDCKKILAGTNFSYKRIFITIRNRVMVLGGVFLAFEFVFILAALISKGEKVLPELGNDILDALVWTGLISWCLSVRALFVGSRDHLNLLSGIKDKISRSIIFLVFGFALVYIKTGLQVIRDIFN